MEEKRKTGNGKGPVEERSSGAGVETTHDVRRAGNSEHGQ